MIGAEYRYVTDVAAVAVLAASLAFLRPGGEWLAPAGRASAPRLEGTRQATSPAVQDIRAALPRVARVTVVAVLVVAFVVSATASTLRFDRYWSTNPARPYIANLHTAFTNAPRDLVVYDQEVPAEMAWALLFPYNRLSNLTTPWSRPAKVPAARPQSRSPRASWTVKDTFAASRSRAAARRARSVTNGCGWLLGPRRSQVQSRKQTFPWTWVMRMAYIASADAKATVRAGATTARSPCTKG